ncbi:MAG: redox-sensing transcriptional repressor Rex [Bacteroidetes bacterium 4572_77]|nr:MAG: redox-sensing transcriptional repressor Rex [Bacteroidetes bacterium 4572_77]
MRKLEGNKKTQTVIPVPTIRRFPMYLSFLKSISTEAGKYISAPDMAGELHIDPTQISKDFSYLKISGKTKVGYEANTLISVIEDFLGYHILRKAVIVGIGNIGVALIKYNEFKKEGMEIIAGFDIDDQVIGQKINNVEIFKMEALSKDFPKEAVDIGIIAVPGNQAQEVADIMIESGMKSIWNFSVRPISASDNIIIENTSIESGLAMIKWKLHRNKPLLYKNRML